MAVATNTVQTPSRVGIREDLSDIIYDISPTETPFVSSIGKTTASNVYHEWQTDSLAAADATNKNVQGDDVTNDSRAATLRMGNYTQLMDKVIGTSSTARAVKTAGRKDEHAYQLAKAGKELKRDMEARLTGNYAAVAPTSSVAGETSGALAHIRTNVSRGTSGANATLSGTTQGYVSAAATNGTQRAFTETLLKAQIANAWTAGGDPSMVLLSATQKQTASTFAGIAQQRRETGNKKAVIVGAADVYVSDFGEVTFVPDRFCSTRDALIFDPEYFKLATLQPFTRDALAKTGHADREMLSIEFTLECNNEAAHGLVADLS